MQKTPPILHEDAAHHAQDRARCCYDGNAANLTFLFMPTNFFRTTAMIALLFIGLVMIARSLRDLSGAAGS